MGNFFFLVIFCHLQSLYFYVSLSALFNFVFLKTLSSIKIETPFTRNFFVSISLKTETSLILTINNAVTFWSLCLLRDLTFFLLTPPIIELSYTILISVSLLSFSCRLLAKYAFLSYQKFTCQLSRQSKSYYELMNDVKVRTQFCLSSQFPSILE